MEYTEALNGTKFNDIVNIVNSVKISIIMPVYNSAAYLDRSIGSFLSQTLQDIELICFDDASKDNSYEILENYSKRDSRIRPFRNPRNSGPAKLRNEGIKLQKGEFIGFIDSDDYVDNNFFENLYKYAKDQDIVIGKYVDSTNNSDDYIPGTKSGIYGYCGDSIWRRSFIKKYKIKFPEDMRYKEDKEFRRIFYSYNPKKFFAPDKGSYYYYKRREGSLCNFNEEQLKDVEERAKIYSKQQLLLIKHEF